MWDPGPPSSSEVALGLTGTLGQPSYRPGRERQREEGDAPEDEAVVPG